MIWPCGGPCSWRRRSCEEVGDGAGCVACIWPINERRGEVGRFDLNCQSTPLALRGTSQGAAVLRFTRRTQSSTERWSSRKDNNFKRVIVMTRARSEGVSVRRRSRRAGGRAGRAQAKQASEPDWLPLELASARAAVGQFGGDQPSTYPPTLIDSLLLQRSSPAQHTLNSPPYHPPPTLLSVCSPSALPRPSSAWPPVPARSPPLSLASVPPPPGSCRRPRGPRRRRLRRTRGLSLLRSTLTTQRVRVRSTRRRASSSLPRS